MPKKQLLRARPLRDSITLLDYRTRSHAVAPVHDFVQASLDDLVQTMEQHRNPKARAPRFSLSSYIRTVTLKQEQRGIEIVGDLEDHFYRMTLNSLAESTVLFRKSAITFKHGATYENKIITLYGAVDASTIRHEVGHGVFYKLPPRSLNQLSRSFSALQEEHKQLVRGGMALSRAVALTANIPLGTYPYAIRNVPVPGDVVYFQSQKGEQSLGTVVSMRQLSSEEVRRYSSSGCPIRGIKKTVVLRTDPSEAFAETFALLTAPEKEQETFPPFRYVTTSGKQWYTTMVDVLRTCLGVDCSAELSCVQLHQKQHRKAYK